MSLCVLFPIKGSHLCCADVWFQLRDAILLGEGRQQWVSLKERLAPIASGHASGLRGGRAEEDMAWLWMWTIGDGEVF